MLILLPPSETKRFGGVGISIDKSAIIWAALDPYRDKLLAKISTQLKSKKRAIEVFKLGKNAQEDLLALSKIQTSPTMPAIERYAGTLYDALDYQSLSDFGKLRVKEKLFIQSALFGLLPATEQIPHYRFSAATKLPGISLTQLWTEAHKAVWPRLAGPILDLRSKSYAALNPIPERESYFVEVVDAKSKKALNHFNKKAKGALARSALELGLENIAQLEEIAAGAGLSVEMSGNTVILKVPTGF